MKQIFSATEFKPTKHSSAKDKADFANKLMDFIASGYKRTKFTKALYSRLSNTFGHIAHYNIEGFYDTWFESQYKQTEFIRHLLNYPCYGDPEYTYSDVETRLIAYIRRWHAEKIR